MYDKEKLFPATATPDSDWWQALWPNPSSVLETVGIREGMVAIDLCCGDGLFTVPMSILLNGQVYAIDIDSQMLGIAKQALANSEAPDCVWIEGDARDMANLVPEKVDVVLIANTFHGVPEQTEMAINAYDVLKPNGQFVVVNWHVLPREETTVLGQPRGPRIDLRMTTDAVREAVEPSGLVFRKSVTLPPYHYGALFQKP